MTTNDKTKTAKRKHLSYGDRCKIETLLDEKHSVRYIAECVNTSPSTISREINKHTHVYRSRQNDCLNSNKCTKRNVCGSASCPQKCRLCNKCKTYCSNYVQVLCDTIANGELCNGCSKRAYCHYEKRFYKALEAEKDYRDMLVGRRNGFDLTGEEIETINSQVSPLIRKGQSPYHIKQTLGEQLKISESTLRRMINGCELDVRSIDLKEAVRRKPRKKRRSMKNELTSPSKAGRMYEDYLKYIEENDVNVVEMDCVEGTKEDKCAILTLHFTAFHLQLYYIMDSHTSECVVATLDKLEEALGQELFTEIFEVILTDNGHEFWDMEGMERSVLKGKRAKIFFCDPNRSDQKGACENNHKLLRNIIPKGTSIDGLMQSDMVLITNHINSYRRKSLFGHSPYEQAASVLPDDFFILLGLEQVPSEDVILSPKLLNTSK